MHYFTCLLYFYSHHRCLYEYGFEKGKWTIVFWSGAEKEQSGSQFPPKSFDNLLIAATLNVTFTVTKWNTKTPPEAIMSEWCSLLQHRSAKMDVTSSAIMLKKIGPFFFSVHIFLFIFFSPLCHYLSEEGWAVTQLTATGSNHEKEELCRHNANHIIIFLLSLSDRKNSWRAWIVLRIPFQPLSHSGPRSLSGSVRGRITESYSQLHTT